MMGIQKRSLYEQCRFSNGDQVAVGINFLLCRDNYEVQSSSGGGIRHICFVKKCEFFFKRVRQNLSSWNINISKPTQPEGIDEYLYSHQLYVLCRDTIRAMAKSAVSIIRCHELGVEIAKNVIWAADCTRLRGVRQKGI